ncbi:MAG: protein kinase, partial [Nitrospira sp.]|nr:protein kinase [Nitrospira sp.]
MANWQIGDKIQNRWEIYKILKGGMGIVYIVYDHEHRDAYATKTFQDEVFAQNPIIADRFTQEALAWVNLDVHQNVTQACFAENIEGKPFLFLEYVSGGDLGGWIGTPRLTEDLPQVLRFAIQFCDGMSYVLSKGIQAHRDI